MTALLPVLLLQAVLIGQPESFPDTPKAVGATALTASGLDTRDAAIVGETTRADAKAFCEAWGRDDTPTRLADCIRDELAGQKGRRRVLAADCVSGRMTTDGQALRLIQGRQYRWRDGSVSSEATFRREIDDSQVEHTGADGGLTYSMQFAALCPKTVAGWPIYDSED